MTNQDKAQQSSADTLTDEPDVRALENDSPVALTDSEVVDATSTASHYEIVSIPADFTLEGLITKWEKKQLEIPGFQRKFIWTHRQASRLIESFLLGLPVPSLFLYADPDTGMLQVIDGQQRLMSIVQFFDKTFKNAKMVKGKMFRLVGLADESLYNNLNVDELEAQYPAKFAQLNDAVMRAFIIKQLDPNDATSIYHIFERLNTGGTVLLGQEIRNCVYHGPLNNLLNELNTYPNWRKVIGKPEPDARMRDIEMILRFVALHFFADEYKKPMKDFLSTAMKLKRNLPKDEAESLGALFKSTCDAIVSKLGENPFHNDTGRMNPAFFDAIFTVIAGHKNELPAYLKEQYESLIKDEDFKTNSSLRTTDADAVANRLKIAKTHILGER